MTFISIASVTLFVYSLIERFGLFRENPASVRVILHSLPFPVIATLLAAAIAWRLFPRRAAVRSLWAVYARLVLLAGVLLLPIGLWLSYLTHFEGTVIRMAQQDFLTLPGEYDETTLSRGRLARPNSIGLYIKDISFRKLPLLSTPVAEADVRYISNSRKTFGDVTISPLRPLFSDWTMARVTGAGYSVAYAIDDQTRREVDRTYVAMKLFPSGAEDFFSPKDLGYYFHLRYFPDYFDNGGRPATHSLEPKNPVFQARVVRHKDILYNGLLTMRNTLRVEGVLFSIKDVRPCVEITFIRDPGMPVLLAGVILSGIGALAAYVGRVGRRSRG